jgi:hypothetical protein
MHKTSDLDVLHMHYERMSPDLLRDRDTSIGGDLDVDDKGSE